MLSVPPASLDNQYGRTHCFGHVTPLAQGKVALRRAAGGAPARVRGVQRARHRPGCRRTAGFLHEPFRFEGGVRARDPRALPGDDERCGDGDAAERRAAAASSVARVDRRAARVPSQGRHASRVPVWKPQRRSQRGKRGDSHSCRFGVRGEPGVGGLLPGSSDRRGASWRPTATCRSSQASSSARCRAPFSWRRRSAAPSRWNASSASSSGTCFPRATGHRNDVARREAAT